MKIKTFFIIVFSLALSGCTDGRSRKAQEHAEIMTGYSPAPASRPISRTQRSSADIYKQTKPKKPIKKISNLPEVKIAILAPLSGEASEIGKSLLDAAQLGLFDKYASLPLSNRHKKLVLLPKDTEGKAKTTAIVAREAISEGAELIIGPLFSHALEEVAPIAKRSGVNIISFSDNSHMAESGVYLFGFMPDQQVKRIIDEAHFRNLEHIALLAPNNEYGHVIAAAFRNIMVLNSKPIAGIEFYSSSSLNVDVPIQLILRGKGKNKNGKKDSPEIDAILIAEGGTKLELIADRLHNFSKGKHQFQLLGTNLWDDKSILGNPVLTGGWFTSSPMRSHLGFEQRFSNHYHYKPHRLASLAYDAIALSATLANVEGKPQFGTKYLTAKQGFRGPADGLFRCKTNGICERAMAVHKVGVRNFTGFASPPRQFDYEN